MNKKRTLTIILVLLVLLLGGASIYVATQLTSRQAVAPTAPTSKPSAEEFCPADVACSATIISGYSYGPCNKDSVPGNYCCLSGQTITDGACTGVTDWVTSAGCKIEATAAAAPVAFPNCSSIAGPATITLGDTATYSAAYHLAPGAALADLAGSIFFSHTTAGVDQKDINELITDGPVAAHPFNKPVPVDGGRLSATFTPTAVGQYWLRCRAWNDGLSECRPRATVSTSPTSNLIRACDGSAPGLADYEKLVTVTAAVCVHGTVTCNPDCPTACGTAASTITTCTDNCGATTKACPATAACHVPAVLEGNKTAFKNVTANTPGVYSLTTETTTVAKSQIYIYTISLTNTSTATASSVVIKDSLADMPVTFMDAQSGCTYAAANTEVTCNTTVQPGQTKTLSFRVKASDGLANGTVISNLARVTYPDGSLDLTKDLSASTVVGCNHTCTADEECTAGLVCDPTTSKCRLPGYLTEEDCTVPVVVERVIVTAAPTRVVVVTAAPTRVVTQVVSEATPTILPETGIFDLPGIATFGGGLLLAVVGILLAL